MFIGHFGVGFAAKRLTPQASLAVLFGAAQLADLLWPVFLAAGIEQVRIQPGGTPFTRLDFISYPYSHSLVTLILFGLVFGYAFATMRPTGPGLDPKAASSRDGTSPRRVMILLAALVVSHWVLDFVTHRPDLPIYPGGPKVGLGLWNSTAATLVVEVALYVTGLVIYARATRARDVTGGWAFPALGALLVIFYVASILGGPPPSVTAIWMGAIFGGAAILALSWWADRHREPRT